MFKTPDDQHSSEFAFVRKDSSRRQPPNLHAPILSFSARLVKYVRERCDGRAPIAYKRAGIDRKLYSKIVSNDFATVSKQTALQLAIGLQLSRSEADEFLHAAGYALSQTIPLDCAFVYCIEQGIWNIRHHNLCQYEGKSRTQRKDGENTQRFGESKRARRHEDRECVGKASFITIGRWLEWGEFLANALKKSSTVAPQMKSELAVIERDLANAVSLREFLSAYVSACEKDVMNVLRLDKSVFGGISVKRKELTWDDNKLARLLLAA